MASPEGGRRRKRAVKAFKRDLILEAARRLFETEGLEGASLRAIAAEAGYTPAALYFHFDSKEAIYAEVLSLSLAALKDAVDRAVAEAATPVERLRAAALGFFDFYAENPRDLELGFYLFRGGMRPKGLGRERDERLNAGLAAALAPIGEAARALSADPDRADRIVADAFAHATGLLLLDHTGRIRLFRVTARDLMADYVDALARRLTAA